MKHKLSVYNIVVAAVWIACIGFIGVDTFLLGDARRAVLEQANRSLQESQEKLAFAQSAGKEETKQRTAERLCKTQESLDTFTCPAASESALIFQIGQLAHTLQLKRFISRMPESAPDKTLNTEERVAEGWLTVEFVADYLKTAAFINSLERNAPVLFVESFQMNRHEENKGELAVRLNVSYLIRKPEKTKAVALAKEAL